MCPERLSGGFGKATGWLYYKEDNSPIWQYHVDFEGEGCFFIYSTTFLSLLLDVKECRTDLAKNTGGFTQALMKIINQIFPNPNKINSLAVIQINFFRKALQAINPRRVSIPHPYFFLYKYSNIKPLIVYHLAL